MSEKRYKIMCNLPHAATEINGIEFEDDAGELVAKDIPEADAKRFKSIPGYEVTLMGDQTESHNDLLNNVDDAHNSVLGAIKKMNVTDIKDFLKVQPDAWNHVLTLEEERSEPRQGVMDAVKSAKASLNDFHKPKQDSTSNSKD